MAEIIDIQEYRAGKESEAEDVTKKQFLKQYKHVLGRIESKLEEIERMDNGLYPGARLADGMPRGSRKSSASDRIDCAVDYVRRIRGKVIAELSELEMLRDEIAAAIASVPGQQHRQLLELRYINFYSWRKIAEKMGYSEDNVYKLHGEALRQLRIKKAA